MAEDQKSDRINTARVFLYSNPHDQLISATSIRGIGWRGVGDDELKDEAMSAATGVFYQRVFAQGFAVGDKPKKIYRAWDDRWNKYDKKNNGYWHPPSPPIRIQLQNIAENARKSAFAKLGWTLVGLVSYPIAAIVNKRAHAEPPPNWKVTINAPEVPKPIKPLGKDGKETTFDQGKESASQELNSDANRVKKDDAYDRYRQSESAQAADKQAVGDEKTEAQLRYEHNARLRMSARRSDDKDIAGEVDKLKKPGEALPTKFGAWVEETRFKFLTKGVDQNAVDHGTIVSNAYHAEHIMAYDLPIGYCSFLAADWAELRKAADWRWCVAVETDADIEKYGTYFKEGKYQRKYPHEHPDYHPAKAAALGMDVTRARQGPAKSGLNNPHATAKPAHDVSR